MYEQIARDIYVDMNQLMIILQTLGTPAHTDIHHVTHPDALAFLKDLAPRKGVPFKDLFPRASPIGIYISLCLIH